MSFIHPEPPRIPPEAPQRRHDPDQWRHDPGGHGRMPISTTQILLGILLLAVAASLAAFLFGFPGDQGLDAAILSPDDGSLHPPGEIIVRIRASGDDDPPRWELSYRSLARPDEWQLIEEGNSSVSPRDIDRGGLEVLQLTEPGDYEVRLVVDNQARTEQIVETVHFTVGG